MVTVAAGVAASVGGGEGSARKAAGSTGTRGTASLRKEPAPTGPPGGAGVFSRVCGCPRGLGFPLPQRHAGEVGSVPESQAGGAGVGVSGL